MLESGKQSNKNRSSFLLINKNSSLSSLHWGKIFMPERIKSFRTPFRYNQFLVGGLGGSPSQCKSPLGTDTGSIKTLLFIFALRIKVRVDKTLNFSESFLWIRFAVTRSHLQSFFVDYASLALLNRTYSVKAMFHLFDRKRRRSIESLSKTNRSHLTRPQSRPN